MQHLYIPFFPHFTGWNTLEPLRDFSYPWEVTAAPNTSFAAYHDGEHLHFCFTAEGPTPLIHVEDNHKLEVTQSERVEIFFRVNEEMQPYYCLEIDPTGRVLDYEAHHYRNFNRNWQWPDPLYIIPQIHNDHYTVEGKVRLKTLEAMSILKGNRMEAGLFRGHCTALLKGKATLKWISWVHPGTPTPDFHVPTAFGTLILQDYPTL
jgi:hypothetical protein